ncbi:response regulator transcription factor [Sphingobacterium spiritivorum]|uniref:response regulator transcription factor n=1 Tax=Sphingobacterium spiritivorum TaxID=258 RepID=UPI003DA39384
MINLTVINQNLPAGLDGKGVEFFFSQETKDIKCLHNGRTYIWEEIPQNILEIIADDMAANPEAVKALKDWNIHNAEEMLKQYTFCRFGGFDNEPDIDSDAQISYTEYFDCGMRGQCKYEGKICATIKVANGVLTKQELQVLKLVAEGLLNKEIAERLNISEHTVNSHNQNIQQKGNFNRKFEMIAFAKDKNLI